MALSSIDRAALFGHEPEDPFAHIPDEVPSGRKPRPSKYDRYKRVSKSSPSALLAGIPEGHSSGAVQETKGKADHNARTKKLYEARGYTYVRCDHYDPRTQKAKDFLGVFDAVAMKEGDCVGVQLTSAPNISTRIRKVRDSVLARAWILAGNRAEVVGWAKGKDGRYEPRVTEVRV